MRFNSRSEAALYLWDYFYIRNVPPPEDAAPWARIEGAVCRIRESEIRLDPPNAPDVRLRHARRVRNAVRLTLRQIDRLSVEPEAWVLDTLADFEALTGDLIQALAEPARRIVVH